MRNAVHFQMDSGALIVRIDNKRYEIKLQPHHIGHEPFNVVRAQIFEHHAGEAIPLYVTEPQHTEFRAYVRALVYLEGKR